MPSFVIVNAWPRPGDTTLVEDEEESSEEERGDEGDIAIVEEEEEEEITIREWGSDLVTICQSVILWTSSAWFVEFGVVII